MIKRLLLSLLVLSSSLMAMDKPQQGQEALLNKTAQELIKINNQINVYQLNRTSFNEQKKRNDLQKITTNLTTNFLPLIADLKGETSLKETLGRAVAAALAYNEQDADTTQSNINTLKTLFSQASATIAGYIKAPQAKIVSSAERSAVISFDKPLSDKAKDIVRAELNRNGQEVLFDGHSSATLTFSPISNINAIIASLNLLLINQPLFENQLVRTLGSVTSDSGNQIVITFNKALTQDQKNKIINFFSQQSTKHQITFSTDNTAITITKDPYHSAAGIADIINNVVLI